MEFDFDEDSLDKNAQEHPIARSTGSAKRTEKRGRKRSTDRQGKEPLFLPSPSPSPTKSDLKVNGTTPLATSTSSALTTYNLPVLTDSFPPVTHCNNDSIMSPFPLSETTHDTSPLSVPNPASMLPDPNTSDLITQPTPSAAQALQVQALMAGLEEDWGVESWDMDVDVVGEGKGGAGFRRRDGVVGKSEGNGNAKEDVGDGSRSRDTDGSGIQEEARRSDVEIFDLKPTSLDLKPMKQETVLSPRIQIKLESHDVAKEEDSDVKPQVDTTSGSGPLTTPVKTRISPLPERSPDLFDDDDDFKDEDLADLAFFNLSPTKPSQKSQSQLMIGEYPIPHPSIHPDSGIPSIKENEKGWLRGVVESVSGGESGMTQENGMEERRGWQGWGEKVLLVKEIIGSASGEVGRELRLVLKDEWAGLVVGVGESVLFFPESFDH